MGSSKTFVINLLFCFTEKQGIVISLLVVLKFVRFQKNSQVTFNVAGVEYGPCEQIIGVTLSRSRQ